MFRNSVDFDCQVDADPKLLSRIYDRSLATTAACMNITC